MSLIRIKAIAFCGVGLLLPLVACSKAKKQEDTRFEAIRLECSGNVLVLNPNRASLISDWIVQGRTLVDTSAEALPASAIDSRYELISRADTENGSELEYRQSGRASDDLTPTKLKLRINPTLTEITVAGEEVLASSQEGESRKTVFRLPLSYQGQQRSRVIGAPGKFWDTRHQYIFHTTSTGAFLDKPDVNNWRYLGIDVFETGSYYLWKRESEATSELSIHQGKEIERLSFLTRDFDKGVKLVMKESPVGVPWQLLFQSGDAPSMELMLGTRTRGDGNEDHVPRSGKWELTLSALLDDSLDGAFGPESSLAADEVRNRPAPGLLSQKSRTLANPSYVTAGYPFARGTLVPSQGVVVEIGDHVIPTQSKALAYWPDGSVKWSLLTFPMPGDLAEAVSEREVGGPTLLLADNTRLRVKAVRPALRDDVIDQPEKGPGVGREGNRLSITTRQLEVVFSTGERWLQSLKWNGTERLNAGDGAALFSASFGKPDGDINGLLFRTVRHGTQQVVFDAKEVEVEEAGVYRTVVRIKGEIVSEGARIDATLRALLYADNPRIDFRVACVFGIDDPRETSLQSLGITVPLAPVDAVSWMQGEEVVGERGGVPSTLLQLTPFLAYQYEGGAATRPLPTEPQKAPLFAKLKFQEGEAIATFRKFAEYAPKGLTVDSRGVTFDLWPSQAGTMDMRRYSARTHRAQGESAPSKWTSEVYYKNHPVYGIGRTFEFSLAFQEPDALGAAASVANFRYPALLHAGVDEYERTGVILPQADRKGWPRAWANWDNFARFWLYHQAKDAWYGFWSYGDVRHHFQSGYGWIVSPDSLKKILETESAEERNRISKRDSVLDYQPSGDWAFDNGRWGWSNTEGLPGFFFQSQYLRNANRAVFEAAEAAAFHANDVVTRHAGPLVGYGTRHGVQHWSDGNHEERQTISLEYKTVYYLTGYPEFLDTINTLYEQHYSRKDVSVHAAHSGRLAGLLFHWETTGDPAEAAELNRYVRTFAVPEGIAIEPSVKFPGAVSIAPPRSLNGGSMFFQTFGGMHSLLEYQSIFNDPQLHASLIQYASACINDPELKKKYFGPKGPSMGQIHWGVLAYAARNAENREIFSDFVRRSLGAKWSRLYQTVSKDPRHWSGKTAFLEGNTPGSFFWMNWAPYFLSPIPEDIVWKDSISREYDAREKEGVPHNARGLSWQRGYDQNEKILKYISQ